MEKPFVLVTWDDAEDPKGGWHDEEEVEKFAQKQCLARSVGYLVRKTDKYVTLAGDWIEDLKQYGRVTKIALPQIISIETLCLNISSQVS